MKIQTLIFALIVFAVAPGWAGAADTDGQESAAAQTAVAEQDATPAQDTDSAREPKKRDRADTRDKETRTSEVAREDDWDPDEVTCKRFAETGSRIKKRYCATNRAWKEMAESGENAVEWIKRNSALRN